MPFRDFCYCALNKWETPESAQKHSGKLENAWKRSGKGSKAFRNGLGKAGKTSRNGLGEPEDAEKPWRNGPGNSLGNGPVEA